MTDIPGFEPGSAAELRWAKSILRDQASWRGIVSGPEIVAMARRIVARHEAGKDQAGQSSTGIPARPASRRSSAS